MKQMMQEVVPNDGFYHFFETEMVAGMANGAWKSKMERK
jgi:hypothetical protein